MTFGSPSVNIVSLAECNIGFQMFFSHSNLDFLLQKVDIMNEFNYILSSWKKCQASCFLLYRSLDKSRTDRPCTSAHGAWSSWHFISHVEHLKSRAELCFIFFSHPHFVCVHSKLIQHYNRTSKTSSKQRECTASSTIYMHDGFWDSTLREAMSKQLHISPTSHHK